MTWIHPLRRKLLRDLSALKGQLVTIALVVACGVAAFVATQSALRSLRDARARFYASSGFGAAMRATSGPSASGSTSIVPLAPTRVEPPARSSAAPAAVTAMIL